MMRFSLMNDSDKKLDIGSQAQKMPTSLSTGMRLILVEFYTISIPHTFTGFADIYERMKQSNFFFNSSRFHRNLGLNMERMN